MRGVSGDMKRGNALEPEAVLAYETHTDRIVQTVGFVSIEGERIGCSPDGYVGDWEGIVEIKAPRAATHLCYLRAGVVPEDYRHQLVHNLYVTGANWCDFVSWCPQFPEPLRLFIVRYARNEAELAAYELTLRQFLAEVDKEVNAIRALVTEAAA
jgi:hypothetical protein